MPEPARTVGPAVGVLTFHRCINYGSYWQARSLVERIRGLGVEAVLLDHRTPSDQIAEYRVALRPTLPTPVPPEDREAYACKARKFDRLFQDLPLSAPFDLDDLSQMPPVETVVVGSDEVWNLRHPWFSGRPAFFGVGLRSRRVVAYAASFGNYSCWEGIGSPWTDFLGQFDALSVRDENSWWMLKNSLEKEVETVLDPCLLNPLPAEGEWNGPRAPFALVYGHNFTPDFATQVRRWSDAQRLPLVSIGYRNDWADHQWITADPHDFAHAVVRAEAVATNFFHGCVFALRHAKPFACEQTPYRSIKVRGLMELLGAEHHLVDADTPAESFDHLLCQPVLPAILNRIGVLRRSSNAYLRGALEC